MKAKGKIYSNIFLVVSVLILALISCADEPILKEYSESEYIGFKAALTAQSRSSVATQCSVPYMSIEEEEWTVTESQSEAVSRDRKSVV